VADRGMVWHYDGMDRNRSFFWTGTPLEARPLFHYAINCSEQQRLEYVMFKRVMDRLSSKYCELNYAQYSAPLGSFRFKLGLLKSKLYLSLSPRLRKLAKALLGRKARCMPPIQISSDACGVKSTVAVRSADTLTCLTSRK